MSLTDHQVRAIHADIRALGVTPEEAVQGTRTEVHGALLAASPCPPDAVDHDAHARHSADAWDRADALIHRAGLTDAPSPIPSSARVVAPIQGRTSSRSASTKAGQQ